MSAPTERAVTLADIARLAGVSPATASRALGAHPHVAPATRERVRRIADELSYVVSPDASRLAGGRTGRVAALVPGLARWSCAEMVDGLATALRGADLDLVLHPVVDAADRVAYFRRLPARRTVDAVVAVAFPVDAAECARLEELDVVVVAAGGSLGTRPSITIDDHAAGRQAVDHLIHLGHTRIGMIETPDAGAAPGPLRRAYERAHADAGLTTHPDLTLRVEGPAGAAGADAMAQLLGLRRPPTAVVAQSDEAALGAVRTLRRAGLRVPADVSVIGMDDQPLAALTDLTTVRRPVREQGTMAGHLVATALAGGDPGRGMVLPTRLTVRGSTAPPRGPTRGTR